MITRTANVYRAKARHLLPVMLLTLPLVLSGKTWAQQVSENHRKAAFLVNLIHFVNWSLPSETESEPFVIGIYGADPFGTIIDKAAAGEKKNSRPVKIERHSDLTGVVQPRCQILFIDQSKMAEWRDLRTTLKGAQVLTVADTAGFPEQGGMVNLQKNDQKIEVEINHRALQQAGLSVSSKLLSLARIIE